MEFTPLERIEQLDEIKSCEGYAVIFKHNTTCPISKGVKAGLEAEIEALKGADHVYYLDLLKHREISDAIAERFEVVHQSPQILLVRRGECLYSQWGYDIRAEEVAGAMG